MPTNETPLPGESLPPDPVKILESLATIAETVGPQVEQALGSIAAEDMTPGDNADQWMTDAQEAAERIQLAMRPILTAILELPDPKSPETTEEPPAETIEADELEPDSNKEHLTETEQGVLSFVQAQGQSVSVGEIADGTDHEIDDVIDKLHFISMLHRLSDRGLLARR